VSFRALTRWLGFTMGGVLLGLALWFALRGPSAPIDPREMPPPREGEVTILFFGDGGDSSPLQRQVAASMLEVCRRLGCSLALLLGDNVYASGPLNGSHDPRLDLAFGIPFAPFAELDGFAFWGSFGNHDVLAGLSNEIGYAAGTPLLEIPGPMFEVTGLPAWLQVMAIYTPTLFKADPLLEGALTPDWESQVRRVENRMCAAGPVRWKILFGHHPIYSTAHGTAKRLERRLLPTIRRCGVDFFLAGHVHQQEHISAPDFEQLIQGAASNPRHSRGWFKWGPRSSFRSEEAGFGVIRFSQIRAWVNYFDREGHILYSWQVSRARPPAGG